LKSTNVSEWTHNFANLGYLTGAKGGERNEITHGNTKPNSVENDSQYYLSADFNENPERIQLGSREKDKSTGKICGRATVPESPDFRQIRPLPSSPPPHPR
jgi:hypothetical protein